MAFPQTRSNLSQWEVPPGIQDLSDFYVGNIQNIKLEKLLRPGFDDNESSTNQGSKVSDTWLLLKSGERASLFSTDEESKEESHLEDTTNVLEEMQCDTNPFAVSLSTSLSNPFSTSFSPPIPISTVSRNPFELTESPTTHPFPFSQTNRKQRTSLASHLSPLQTRIESSEDCENPFIQQGFSASCPSEDTRDRNPPQQINLAELFSKSPLIPVSCSATSTEEDQPMAEDNRDLLPMPHISESCESEDSVLSRWERPPPLPTVLTLEYEQPIAAVKVSNTTNSPPSIHIDTKSYLPSVSSLRSSEGETHRSDLQKLKTHFYHRQHPGLQRLNTCVKFPGGKMKMKALKAGDEIKKRNKSEHSILLCVLRACKDGIEVHVHVSEQRLRSGEYCVIWPENQYRVKNPSPRQCAVVQFSYTF